jgi:hypothetical protein
MTLVHCFFLGGVVFGESGFQVSVLLLQRLQHRRDTFCEACSTFLLDVCIDAIIRVSLGYCVVAEVVCNWYLHRY